MVSFVPSPSAHLLLVHGDMGVPMRMRMTVAMVMPMAVRVSVVMMSTSGPHAEQVDGETETRHQKQLLKLHLWRVEPVTSSARSLPFPRPTHTLWIASKMMKMEMRMRKEPFVNPLRVSTREYPKVY